MVSSSSTNKSSSVKTNASNMISSLSRRISKKPSGQKKWTTLEHNGVIFPPPYQHHGVQILYQGMPVYLTPEQEEVATLFAEMRNTVYYHKPLFRENFWNDWRELLGDNHVIQNLDDCDFTPIYEWSMQEKQRKKLKLMSVEEKMIIKVEKLKQEEKYMWAVLDGVKEKVGNFRVEPPGLFRGRGEHPKMGKLRKRIRPCDITINIGREAPIPESPIPGERWKEVRHDNNVTWLAFWNDSINPKMFKYAFPRTSSVLNGQRENSKRQIEVATSLINNLSLSTGIEKERDPFIHSFFNRLAL